MIVFQGLTSEEIQRAFQHIEDAIDLSHRSIILFDYLDNALYRIFAALERAYSFCDYWFSLGFTEVNTGRLFKPYRLFEAQTISRHPEWANSELFSTLRDVRDSTEYRLCIQQLRHDITHNLDPREYVVRYDQTQSLVEITEPAVPVDKVLIDRAKKLLGDLFKIRGLEAYELARSMEKYSVRLITPADMDYWTDADSPLF